MSDDLKNINKGIMKKNGKPYLPITHESLVVDNDGVSIDKKYITKAYVRGLASEYYVEQYVDEYVTYHLAPIKDAIWNEDTGLLKRTGDLEAAIEEGGVVYESIKANKEAIEAENERAVIAEEELSNIIVKESEDRIEADEILDSKILDEENRAVAKETELNNKIDNSKELIDILNGDVNTAGSVANTVNIETQRSIEVENSLRESIKENRSLIDILNGSTTTEGSVKKQLKDTVDSFNVVALKLCSRITANKKSIDILNDAWVEMLNDLSQIHDHDNKQVLDSITLYDIENWNAKSNFSGSYNDLIDLPKLPTKFSDLVNDINLATETFVIDKIAEINLSDYATLDDISTLVDEDKLTMTLNDYVLNKDLEDNYATVLYVDKIIKEHEHDVMSDADVDEIFNNLY